MSSHSIHTQSNSALQDAPRASATALFDQVMVTAVVIAIAYITSIMVGWL
jgi:CHASE3 domain sensor protein